MADDRDQGPHYIPELDPGNKKSPRDTGGLTYGILVLLPFTMAGTYFGIRDDNTHLLVMGIVSIILTIASLIFILHLKKNS